MIKNIHCESILAIFLIFLLAACTTTETHQTKTIARDMRVESKIHVVDIGVMTRQISAKSANKNRILIKKKMKIYPNQWYLLKAPTILDFESKKKNGKNSRKEIYYAGVEGKYGLNVFYAKLGDNFHEIHAKPPEKNIPKAMFLALSGIDGSPDSFEITPKKKLVPSLKDMDQIIHIDSSDRNFNIFRIKYENGQLFVSLIQMSIY